MTTLEDHGVITALKPIRGGWHYMQTQGGEVWRIPATGSAASGSKLVEEVRTFRVNQGIEVGDPVADVADYTKKNSPPNDKFKGRAKLGHIRVKEKEPLIQRCRESLAELQEARARLTDPDEATRRAAICQHCPQNIRWEVSGCAECNEKVNYLGACIRQRATFPLDGALKACRLHGFHLPTEVFIDRSYLPERHADAPSGCWVGQIV